MMDHRGRLVRASASVDPNTGQIAESAMLLSFANAPGSVQCLGVAVIEPGASATNVVAHCTAEVMFVAEGCGQLLTSAGAIEFLKGDAIYIPPDLKHAIRNTGQTTLVSVYSFPTPDRPADSAAPR